MRSLTRFYRPTGASPSRAKYHFLYGSRRPSKGRGRVFAALGLALLSVPAYVLIRISARDEFPWPKKAYAETPNGDDSSFVLYRGRPMQPGRNYSSSRNDWREDEGAASPVGAETTSTDAGSDSSQNKAWSAVTSRVASLRAGFASLPDKLTDLIVPDWVRILPGFVNKLQNELSMAPGSLAEEIWQEANDPEINPEIVWEANVRVSNDICDDEKTFRRLRKEKTREALAKYLNVPLKDIHPDDVPTIAMCGSGGGLRALVVGSSSFLSAKEAGLFDCLTYTAGVSGSCWLQSLYFSSLIRQNHNRLINHLKNRLGVHIAYPPAAFDLINSAPTNKYLLSGLIEKLIGVPDADFGIVDVYGILLTARLFVPKGELTVSDSDLKVSNQRAFVARGEHPLPIYTAVRHEIPESEKGKDGAVADPVSAQKRAIKEDWFQWFEFTPYEFWCEELEAGIPTWAVGRDFSGGRTVWRNNGLTLPEVRLPLLLGIWGSAFCATLSHYYQEIRPVVKGLAGFSGVDNILMERDEDLIKMHPIDPATIPNYIRGMEGKLPDTVPRSMFNEERLKLMDAGMSNNLPIYPLLRPGRDVDIIISFDVSADAKQDNWLRVVEGYARQRGIKGWPIGAGWPPADMPGEQIERELESAHASSEADAERRLKAASGGDATVETTRQQDARADRANEQRQPDAQKAPGKDAASTDLTYCNVWVGSTTERRSSDDERPPPSKLRDDDMELMSPDAGICVIYFPLLPNPTVQGVDPHKSAFMSTWNFVYTPEQVESVVELARANFEAGKDQTKRAVRAVWERKRKIRLESERETRERKRRAQLRSGRGVGKAAWEDGGDQFS